MKSNSFYFINYGPIYYFALIFGVLPFKYRKTAIAESANFVFSHGTAGKIFCYIFFLINLYTAVFIVKGMMEATSIYSSCFDEFCSMGVCRNVCAHFAILWLNYLANFGSSVTILFLRRKRTLNCLNDVHALLLKSTPDDRFRAPAWIVLFFMIIHCSTFFFHWKRSHFRFQFVQDYLPLYMTQCIPIVSENLISILLLIAENSFALINKRVKELADKKQFVFVEGELVTTSLDQMKRLYSETADICRSITECFGIDFLITGFCTTMRFIYFLFITLKYMAEQKVVQESGGFVLPSYDSIVFFVAVLGKLFYLCYRCDCVLAEANDVVPNLYNLLNKFRFAMNERKAWEVEEFLQFIQCQHICFHACDYFTLNRRFICSVFGLTLTYFIVLMQFQASHSI